MSSFVLAAARVHARYKRRYPHLPSHHMTVQHVKDRWYWNQISHVKRETLGKFRALETL